ncbi:hypothetical protein KRR55_07990 [Paeniglutamicibacter sp. ABSL32-1]|uniref:hypothetical protein n=1 Tax=Paeniglutamicibacter quisquiliarum TaxID=2849498 RepID=UPI001C2DA3D6|nr:hypothetical protein [Paeniglutamicibacter quisquiliarum]MBV1779049.1 hypothetical protein [Paeniglutamicibacter quisquiliarum]
MEKRDNWGNPGMLLTWNPKYWSKEQWVPHYDKAVDRTLRDEPVTTTWSVGQKTEIKRYTEVWLHLQGSGDRGLIGHGLVHSEPFVEEHFFFESQLSHHYAEIIFVDLWPWEDRIDIEELKVECPSIPWNSIRQSGFSLAPEQADELRKAWHSTPRPGPSK